MKNITWHWSDHPLGNPIDPTDPDSPLTPPSVLLAIRYEKDETLLRNIVGMSNRTPETITSDEKKAMKDVLMEWLSPQVNDRDALLVK